jgi:hypothetical protein
MTRFVLIVALLFVGACKKSAAVKEFTCDDVSANSARIMKEMSLGPDFVSRCKAENFSPAIRKCLSTAPDMDKLAACFPVEKLPPRAPQPPIITPDEGLKHQADAAK